MIDGDVTLEVNGASSFVRTGPHSEHDTGSVEPDDLLGAGQTEPVVSTPFRRGSSLDRRIFRTDSRLSDCFGLKLT